MLIKRLDGMRKWIGQYQHPSEQRLVEDIRPRTRMSLVNASLVKRVKLNLVSESLVKCIDLSPLKTLDMNLTNFIIDDECLPQELMVLNFLDCEFKERLQLPKTTTRLSIKNTVPGRMKRRRRGRMWYEFSIENTQNLQKLSLDHYSRTIDLNQYPNLRYLSLKNFMGNLIGPLPKHLNYFALDFNPTVEQNTINYDFSGLHHVILQHVDLKGSILENITHLSLNACSNINSSFKDMEKISLSSISPLYLNELDLRESSCINVELKYMELDKLVLHENMKVIKIIKKCEIKYFHLPSLAKIEEFVLRQSQVEGKSCLDFPFVLNQDLIKFKSDISINTIDENKDLLEYFEADYSIIEKSNLMDL